MRKLVCPWWRCKTSDRTSSIQWWPKTKKVNQRVSIKSERKTYFASLVKMLNEQPLLQKQVAPVPVDGDKPYNNFCPLDYTNHLDKHMEVYFYPMQHLNSHLPWTPIVYKISIVLVWLFRETTDNAHRTRAHSLRLDHLIDYCASILWRCNVQR